MQRGRIQRVPGSAHAQPPQLLQLSRAHHGHHSAAGRQVVAAVRLQPQQPQGAATAGAATSTGAAVGL